MEAIFYILILVIVLVGYFKLCDFIADKSENNYNLVWIVSFFISPIVGLLIVIAEKK